MGRLRPPHFAYRVLMPTPPLAPQRPLERTAQGETRVDPYAWLSRRDDPAVTEYLTAENAYADTILAPRAEAAGALYEEMRLRIKEEDRSVPSRQGNFEYWSETDECDQYARHFRRRVRDDAGAPLANPGPDELLFDTNAAAANLEYYDLGILSVSPDGTLMAWGCDIEGDELHELRVRELASGKDLDDVVSDVAPGAAWSLDGSTLFYARVDDTHRTHQVWRHELGTPQTDDVCIFEELDPSFSVDFGATKTNAYVIVNSSSSTTSEQHYLDAATPGDSPICFATRQTGIEYDIDFDPGDNDRPAQWIILHNTDAPDGRISRCNLNNTNPEVWEDLVPHVPGIRRMGFDLSTHHLAIAERHAASTQLRIVDLRDGSERVITGGEAATIELLGNDEPDEPLRYARTSLIEPRTTIDVDLASGAEAVRKQQEVLGTFDQSNYVTERLWANAEDGTQIPLSVARRKDVPLDGTAPCLLYGYGSYEISVDPTFSSLRLSLLDRGAVFAIAHVRGGGELGRPWYEDGKLGLKHHTFSDFVAAADHLVSSGHTTHERLAIRGRSAGGLLIGAVLNLRPDLCAVASLEVPFVDALTTMLDDSIPLTTLEYEEWGNPNIAEQYAWIRGYSPIDNLQDATYPAMHVSGGLNDPRVGYWEPAKYVATIRSRITCRGPVILRMEMGSGHGGPSGRYASWKEEALVMRFLLDNVGVTD